MIMQYKPGEIVPDSGVYLVTHDATHHQPHEVTVVKGKPFPPCHGCKHPRFALVRAAVHIDEHPQLSYTGYLSTILTARLPNRGGLLG
jgi:hypothetical protein